jgi:hypothetical protein
VRRLLFALLCLPALASAQQPGGGAPLSYEAITHAKVGTWAEYVTTMKGRPEQVKVRYTLVERSDKRIAVEMDGTTPMGPMLVRMDYVPAGANAWKVERARMQLGAQGAVEVPIPPSTPLLKKGADDSDLVGKSTVKTPIGSFECKQFKKSMQGAQGQPPMVFNVWISDKALPVGLVKQATVDENLTVMLTAVGEGGKPKMTEKK